jgi:hypothetical protein
MGVYDSFFGRCAKCGTEIEIQVKAFNSNCATFYKGDAVLMSEAPDNFMLEDRHSCYECGYVNTIVVKDRVFVGFDKEMK